MSRQAAVTSDSFNQEEIHVSVFSICQISNASVLICTQWQRAAENKGSVCLRLSCFFKHVPVISFWTWQLVIRLTSANHSFNRCTSGSKWQIINMCMFTVYIRFIKLLHPQGYHSPSCRVHFRASGFVFPFTEDVWSLVWSFLIHIYIWVHLKKNLRYTGASQKNHNNGEDCWIGNGPEDGHWHPP